MSVRPRWSRDRLAYTKLLRLQGLYGKGLKDVLLKMEFREVYFLSLLPDTPIPSNLVETQGPVIDHAWVEGETCSETFEVLTPHERWVCYLILHVDDRQELLEELGMSGTTYWRTVQEIRRKLSEH